MFPDGKTLPVVMGGSDDSFTLDTPAIDLGQNSSPAPVETPPEFSEFAQGILNQIPEQDRKIVGKYIKDWDGNVTKKFQEIHTQYEPYKAFGTVEDLQQSMSYIEMLNDDPIAFIAKVQEALEEMGMLEDTDDGYEEPVGTVPDQFKGVDPALVQKFMQQEARLSQMEEFFETQNANAQQQEQMQALDSLFEDMHNTHGDFSEDFVLVQLSKGKTPDEALEAWNKELERFGSPRKSAPNLFRGPGGVPGGQVDPSKLNKNDRKAYMTQALLSAQD